jgi:AbrB family looped-hinge helix DNA binding protein
VGKNMTTTTVDQKNRIVIDKATRAKTHLKAGDTVIIQAIDDHSFKVQVLDFSGKVEDDPAWKALHEPAKIKHYIPPEELEKYMEEKMWEE